MNISLEWLFYEYSPEVEVSQVSVELTRNKVTRGCSDINPIFSVWWDLPTLQ
jgi:hypothetical protein